MSFTSLSLPQSENTFKLALRVPLKPQSTPNLPHFSVFCAKNKRRAATVRGAGTGGSSTRTARRLEYCRNHKIAYGRGKVGHFSGSAPRTAVLRPQTSPAQFRCPARGICGCENQQWRPAPVLHRLLLHLLCVVAQNKKKQYFYFYSLITDSRYERKTTSHKIYKKWKRKVCKIRENKTSELEGKHQNFYFTITTRDLTVSRSKYLSKF